MVRPKGLEPLAHCLEGSCSIHLSYGRMFHLSELRFISYYNPAAKVKPYAKKSKRAVTKRRRWRQRAKTIGKQLRFWYTGKHKSLQRFAKKRGLYG